MWQVLIPIIARDGIPVAELLYKKWSSGLEPTPADFAELRAAAMQTAIDRTKARLAAAGIPLDSEKAKEILALVS